MLPLLSLVGRPLCCSTMRKLLLVALVRAKPKDHPRVSWTGSSRFFSRALVFSRRWQQLPCFFAAQIDGIDFRATGLV